MNRGTFNMATVLPANILEIHKMPDGGYLVGDGYRMSGEYRTMLFASSSIDEALKYIKSKLEPKAK